MPSSDFPPIPDGPVQEGARWRHHAPSSEQVAAWFATQPLDEGMPHEHYVGGVVIIPQSMKVKYQRKNGEGTVERHEMVYTPYVQIGTRLAYFRRLAEYRELIPVIEAAEVPRSSNPASPYFNGHMPDGLWWHIIANDTGNTVRFLCATYRVAMYEPTTYAAKLKGGVAMPMLGGEGTKQVGGGADPNGLMKAQTGAIGRALGVAGILVVGTGVATAEDMQEYTASAAAAPADPVLPTVPSEIAPGEPPQTSPQQQLDALRERILSLQTTMQEAKPQAWAQFIAWWQERARQEGWNVLQDVPMQALKGVLAKMQQLDATMEAEAVTPAVSEA